MIYIYLNTHAARSNRILSRVWEFARRVRLKGDARGRLTFSRVFNVWFCNSNSFFFPQRNFLHKCEVELMAEGPKVDTYDVYYSCSQCSFNSMVVVVGDGDAEWWYDFVWMGYVNACGVLEHGGNMFSTVWSKFNVSTYSSTVWWKCASIYGVLFALAMNGKINRSSQSFVFDGCVPRRRYIIYRRRNWRVCNTHTHTRTPNKTLQWQLQRLQSFRLAMLAI